MLEIVEDGASTFLLGRMIVIVPVDHLELKWFPPQSPLSDTLPPCSNGPFCEREDKRMSDGRVLTPLRPFVDAHRCTGSWCDKPPRAQRGSASSAGPQTAAPRRAHSDTQPWYAWRRS